MAPCQGRAAPAQHGMAVGRQDWGQILCPSPHPQPKSPGYFSCLCCVNAEAPWPYLRVHDPWFEWGQQSSLDPAPTSPGTTVLSNGACLEEGT